jgi:tartrate/fumarate subfamily iron-sulfur-dependent hydro-lyase beta chain
MEYHFDLPVTKDVIESLKLGDIVYLSGLISTGRDQVHKRIIENTEKNIPIPADLERIRGGAIYHMGPIVKQRENGSFEIISGGPTTSARMNSLQVQVCQLLDIHFVIGKGGMTISNWKDAQAVYLAFPGGVGALAAKFLKDIKSVVWMDLGVPEAAWIISVRDFGPFIVTIDCLGNRL